MEKVSFIIPCYCSEKTISAVVSEITDTIKPLDYTYEIILVNDSSPDHTFEKITELAASNPNIIGIDLAKNFGQHAALMAGLRHSSGDLIVCLDDDGQTPANEVVKLLDKIKMGYDVVYASYKSKKHSAFRNFGSKVNSKMAEIMIGKPKELYITSYFVMKNFIRDEILRYEQCYPYIIGLVLRSTNNICNVEVTHRSRESGSSGYTLRKLCSLWMNGFTSFSVKPLRMASYLGVLTACIGFLYLIYILAAYFMDKTTLMGWSSTMAVILIIGGMILLVLGMLGEYVGRIFMCTNSAPQYVIREVTHGTQEIK